MPTNEEIYDEAVALHDRGKTDEAIGKLNELVSGAPDYAIAYSALSVYYGKQEQYDKAIENAKKVCELEPNDPFSFVALSLMCQKGGKFEEAENALIRARQVEAALG